ncbi:MAG: lipid A biosynthesis acyltransferase [Thiolinea sp.]
MLRLSRSEQHSWRYDLVFPCLSHLPPAWAYRLAAWQGRYFYHRRQAERERIRVQMQAVFPEAETALLDSWIQTHFRMIEQEALDTWFLDGRGVDKQVELQDFAAVEQLRANGQRVLLTGGHFGRFWMAGPAMRRRGHRVGTLTRDGGQDNVHGLHPAEFRYRRFKLDKLAAALGGPFLVEGHDLRPLYRELDRSLITLIFDVPYRETPPGCVTVPFFNGKIKVPAGVYKIAKKTQAVVVPFYVCDHQGGKVSVAYSEPLEPNNYNEEEFMSLLTKELEMRIKTQPGHWWLWEALPLLWSNHK